MWTQPLRERYLDGYVRVRVERAHVFRSVLGAEILKYPCEHARVGDRRADRAVPGAAGGQAYCGRLEQVLVPLTARSVTRDQVQILAAPDEPHRTGDRLAGNPASRGEFKLVRAFQGSLEAGECHGVIFPFLWTRRRLFARLSAIYGAAIPMARKSGMTIGMRMKTSSDPSTASVLPLASRGSDPLVASVPPVDEQAGVVVGGVCPGEVSGVEVVVPVVREALVQVLAVYRQDAGVVVPGDDLGGRLDVRQEVPEYRQFVLVGADEADRFGEPVSFVAVEEVLVDVCGEFVVLDEGEHRVDALVRVDLAQRVQVGRVDGVLEDGADLDGYCGGAVADRDAAQQAGMVRGGEQQRGCADVGTDGVRPGQPERLDGVRDELAHRG